MTSDASKFIDLLYKDGRIVTFGNKNMGHVIRKCTIGKNDIAMKNILSLKVCNTTFLAFVNYMIEVILSNLKKTNVKFMTR